LRARVCSFRVATRYAIGILALALLSLATPAAAGPAEAPPAVEGLTARQLAGQRVVYSYSGLTPPEALFDQIRACEAAGVIFFGQNIDPNNSPAQIRAVIDQLQAANEDCPGDAPLLMMTDQEGGIVRRLPGEPVLSAKWVAGGPNPVLLARQAGQGAAQTMLSAGMNLNLAPVADVFRAPLNFIDRFQRSFGHNPFSVSRLTREFLVAQQAQGVAATAKHFPGLGAATINQNTDDGPVTLELSRRELLTVDEAPYRSIIGAGVELVMASWALYPSLDPDWPAGLSHKIVQGHLRGLFRFGGVTITDAMEAGALTPFGTPDENSVRAASVGMDLLMYSDKDVNQGIAGLDALTAALESGELDRATFEQGAARVLELRQSLQ
jgi:beta-N-acetylhexosaminidase